MSYRTVSAAIHAFGLVVFILIGTKLGYFAAGVLCGALVADLGALTSKTRKPR